MTEISLSYIDGQVIKDAEALLQRYEIALFTSEDTLQGEPSFGLGIGDFVSEPNDEGTSRAIATLIKARSTIFPEIKILSLNVTRPQLNQITINLSVLIVPFGTTANIQKTIGV